MGGTALRTPADIGGDDEEQEPSLVRNHAGDIDVKHLPTGGATIDADQYTQAHTYTYTAVLPSIGRRSVSGLVSRSAV